jgi:hypothetical protein
VCISFGLKKEEEKERGRWKGERREEGQARNSPLAQLLLWALYGQEKEGESFIYKYSKIFIYF